MTTMDSSTDRELLRRYAQGRGEDAFAELVRRHVNLVYSAALRQVRAASLVEEVAQSVFVDLANNATRLTQGTDAQYPDTLTPWLYQVTRRTAANVLRREMRRQLREQLATELSTMNAPDATWTEIEPLLDEAVSALEEGDRDAVLLRYFENKSLREVGRHLGVSEDAAQKRVTRAIERVRAFFAKRGVTVSASALALTISTQAVQAAPVGFIAVLTVAGVGGAALGVTTIAATTQAIAMTTLQKTVATVIIVALAGAGLHQASQARQFRAENQALQLQQAASAGQIERLKAENAKFAKARPETAARAGMPVEQYYELLRLRSKVQLSAVEIAGLKSALAEQPEKMPDFMVKTLSKMVASMIEDQTRAEKATVAGRMKKLSAALGLTAEQQQLAGDILQANARARAELVISRVSGAQPYEEIRAQKQSLEEAEDRSLAAVFSADQMGNYTKLRDQEVDANYRSWVIRETERVARETQITKEQMPKVAAVLYSLKPGAGGESIPWYSNATEQMEMRMRAVGAILSPEQVQRYRQVMSADIEGYAQVAKIGRALKGQ